MKTFKNPILTHLADPDVLFYDGVYYLYATSYSSGEDIDDYYKVYTSTDLVNWENKGECFRTPELTRWYWAPDVKMVNSICFIQLTNILVWLLLILRLVLSKLLAL